MFSLWAMVHHVRLWFCHSAAVEMVVNGVLRTLWVMSRGVRFKTIPKRNACIPPRALARSIDDHILSRA